MTSGWGEQTRFFFGLTPDQVIRAAETSGMELTGYCAALNSFENRVYELEVEKADAAAPASSASSRRRVAKFYRPGRWSREQILEEHAFLRELQEAEIPAIAPLPFPDGSTLHQTPDGIHYAVFPKIGGRAPDEFAPEQLERVGRLLARIHAVGAARKADHRIELTPETYGLSNIEFVLKGGFLSPELRGRYERAALRVCDLARERFKRANPRIQRVHGDCHPGNLLWNDAGPFFLDFDDMVRGPAVQDVWLLVPGRDPEALRLRESLLEGYSQMRGFDRAELELVEALRGLRFIHYSAWIARRWEDPAFPAAFPEFGSPAYWADETMDLEQQIRVLEGQA